ncbi:hypothetical protein ACC696_01950 [Rhizobium ruizarguesonis]
MPTFEPEQTALDTAIKHTDPPAEGTLKTEILPPNSTPTSPDTPSDGSNKQLQLVPPFEPAMGGFVVSRNPRNGYAESVAIAGATTNPTDDQLAFKSAIEATELVVRSIFPATLGEKDKSRLSAYIDRLVLVAKYGLQAESPSKVAQSALVEYQKSVTYREGPAVKNKYMIELGVAALLFLAISLATYVLVLEVVPLGKYQSLVRNANFLLVWAGAMVGAWLSFGIRNIELAFSNLGRLEADLLKPPIRLVFTGLLAVVLSLIFVLEVVQFKIGQLDTSHILTSELTAILIGLFCGIGEQVLPTTVGRRATQFLSQVEDSSSKKSGGQ